MGSSPRHRLQQWRTIALSAFEAVDVLSLAADPTIGRAIRSTV